MEEFIKLFADLFEDVQQDSLNEDTLFRNLDEWDSIAALSVIGMIDEEYGVTLNAEDMLASKTLNDLYNRILLKK